MLLNTIITAWALSFVAYVSAAPSNAQGQPCGFKIAPCPTDFVCRANRPWCTNLNRCSGTCVPVYSPTKSSQSPVTEPTQPPLRAYQSCGGRRLQPVECKDGFECLDDPRHGPSCGMACDLPGICISKNVQHCGGYPGIFKPCPEGYRCYDGPNDGCDPFNFGADCPGICL